MVFEFHHYHPSKNNELRLTIDAMHFQLCRRSLTSRHMESRKSNFITSNLFCRYKYIYDRLPKEFVDIFPFKSYV